MPFVQPYQLLLRTNMGERGWYDNLNIVTILKAGDDIQYLRNLSIHLYFSTCIGGLWLVDFSICFHIHKGLVKSFSKRNYISFQLNDLYHVNEGPFSTNAVFICTLANIESSDHHVFVENLSFMLYWYILFFPF